MSTPEERDGTRLGQFAELLEQLPSSPIGDLLAAALVIYEQIEVPAVRHLAEDGMVALRAIASRAKSGDVLFGDPPNLARELTDLEFLQLARIDVSIVEMCYCCEMIQKAADEGWGGSPRVRFYLNGLYYYASSLFLVDTSKPTHKGLPMGGTVIRALQPIGLAGILDPIKAVFGEPLGDTTFGQTILNLRHSDLVHGDFSPERVEYLVNQSQIRDPKQHERFTHLIWVFFHRLILFRLKLLALIASDGKDIAAVTLRYLEAAKARKEASEKSTKGA